MHPKDMTLRPIIRKAVASKFNKFFATIECRIAKKLRSVSRDAWKKYETVSQADGENLCELWWVSSKILHSLEVNKAAGLDTGKIIELNYWTGASNNVFCKMSVPKSKNLLEFSISWGRLGISRWPFWFMENFQSLSKFFTFHSTD